VAVHKPGFFKERWGYAIADHDIHLVKQGSGTLIDIDLNGKKAGGLKPLLVVEGVTVAELSNPKNFLF
jgi:hypothetical protein